MTHTCTFTIGATPAMHEDGDGDVRRCACGRRAGTNGQSSRVEPAPHAPLGQVRDERAEDAPPGLPDDPSQLRDRGESVATLPAGSASLRHRGAS